MKIDVCVTPQEATEDRVKDRAVAVIDVLRASTTILYALANGARAVIPTDSVADAMEKAQQFERETLLLCGERDGKKIVGFDLGNSPFEYIATVVTGKTLIYSSTNGSRTLLKTHGAKSVIVSAFNNLSASIHFLLQQQCDVVLLCSGKLDRFALEDAVCAGLMANMMAEINHEATFTDGALAASALAVVHSNNILGMLDLCNHGVYLKSIGMEPDLPVCAEIDRFSTVPIFHEGKILRPSGNELET